jgi:hypothetical protein
LLQPEATGRRRDTARRDKVAEKKAPESLIPDAALVYGVHDRKQPMVEPNGRALLAAGRYLVEHPDRSALLGAGHR